MKELRINIWDVYDTGGVICITTNGYVRYNGDAVMGRGTARQAAQRWRMLPQILGNLIKANGDIVQLIRPRLLSFPVKPTKGIATNQNVTQHWCHRYPSGSIVPGWAMKASLSLIKDSLRQLDTLRQQHNWKNVYLPRPGCGAGELDWESQVKPLCEKHGDWLIVVNR